MTEVISFVKKENTFYYEIKHMNRELKVSFPKTNVVYGNAPYMGDIILKEGENELGRITWYGIKNVLDNNKDALEKEITLKNLSKWDLHDILGAIKTYETNYKTRNLSIGMYNDLSNVAGAVYYLINKF